MGERDGLRIIRAANPAPLMLDGTRTHIVGRDRIAIIDPGPELPEHLDAVAEVIGDGVVVSILLTHDHPDHAEGARALSARVDAPVRGVAAGSLAAGARIDTDAGALHVIATPGHTPDHAAFHWPAGRAAFVGDLMLGGLDTALVAPPEGDLEAYLQSLRRVQSLDVEVLYPAHGEPFEQPAVALDRYVAHRHERLARVRRALSDAGAAGASPEQVMSIVYGADLNPRLRPAASGATLAYLRWLEAAGEASVEEGRWRA
ncbi:MAG TPA: MBL fold metallo-hydrolase [Longimicrobiales bacterium]|nr:MBL fold metallo-hydrolase [Longimicrobiales bacterium]